MSKKKKKDQYEDWIKNLRIIPSKERDHRIVKAEEEARQEYFNKQGRSPEEDEISIQVNFRKAPHVFRRPRRSDTSWTHKALEKIHPLLNLSGCCHSSSFLLFHLFLHFLLTHRKRIYIF